ncbi:hypothetical protein ACT6QG_09145 [Xanthobacter sp. TB0136]|uniref:hypothetical protein n=1 Tax=Xanthobacter sp. TB0136 TaxID=3459177 RepID=UPI004039DA11
MPAPSRKAAAPRIRALDTPARPCATMPGSAAAKGRGKAAPGQVFRDFVATLERLDKVRRHKAGPTGAEG